VLDEGFKAALAEGFNNENGLNPMTGAPFCADDILSV
jgi:hypothetical protein